MGIRFISFSEKAGIIRCNNTEKDNMLKLLHSLDSISSKKVKIKPVATSGTLHSLMKKNMSTYF